jgi:hypothetical protein
MKKISAWSILVLLSSVVSTAQSNGYLDRFLTEKSVSVGEVTYLVLAASGRVADDADLVSAFEFATRMGWAPSGVGIDEPVSLAAYSYLLMQAFELKGGIMYALAPGPRYAYRELASLQVIQGRSDPDAPLDGSTAIRMLGMIFDIVGGFE